MIPLKPLAPGAQGDLTRRKQNVCRPQPTATAVRVSSSCLPRCSPAPSFSVTKSSQSPAICPEGAIVNEHKFDGVTSCTTSIRPSVAFSDRGGARQSETVKGRAALHRNHHSHLLIEEGKADGRRRLNRLHAACFAGSYDYTGPKTSFWPD